MKRPCTRYARRAGPPTSPTSLSWEEGSRKDLVDISLLIRFVAVADELHFPRAADALNIPLAALYSSIEKLENELGQPLFVRDSAQTRLTKAGALLLVTAREEIAAAPTPAPKPVVPPGGKAKASKGKGRTPVVKGQPKPYKKRQGR